MDVTHPRRLTPCEDDGIAAAVCDVTGVQAQSDERRVGPSQQLVDLARCLDIGSGMRMESRDQPHLALDLPLRALPQMPLRRIQITRPRTFIRAFA